MRRSISTFILFILCGLMTFVTAARADSDHYVKKGTWFDTMVASQAAAMDAARVQATIPPLPLLTVNDYTFTAWIKTKQDGTIVALAVPGKKWLSQGKTFFIGGQSIGMDIGWVGYAGGSHQNIKDGRWHHVALVQERGSQRFYVDGAEAGHGRLEAGPTPADAVLMLGYTSPNFPNNGRNQFNGQMDDIRVFVKALKPEEIEQIANEKSSKEPTGQLLRLTFDSDKEPSPELIGAKIAEGRTGNGILFEGDARAVLEAGKSSLTSKLWAQLTRDFTDPKSKQEMEWEQADGMWYSWSPGAYQRLALAYAASIKSGLRHEAEKLAESAENFDDVRRVREIYLKYQDQRIRDEKLAQYQLPALRDMILGIAARNGGTYEAKSKEFTARIERASQKILSGDFDEEAIDNEIRQIRYEALFQNNPKVDFDKVIFIKRQSYNGNHYYTEFINGSHRGGGNICILDLKTGETTDVVKGLPEGGVFRRFDLSYDRQRIVFDWKPDWENGYRIYECNVDGTGLRQLTFPPDYEEELKQKYRIANYHHATDDMDPCYLPTGEIVFVSTRCEFGILCDQPDIFTTTTLFKIDADGGNMQMLSKSSVSEAAPSITPDGRILYTRWEYVDKGSSCVKCIWSMKPDGSGSAEVYGNDIATPSSMLFSRSIPGSTNKYVMIGSPHCCPWVGLGTVIRLNMNKNIRTREPMEYMTPNVDVQGLGGEAKLVYRVNGKWERNTNGPIYRDPYPLCEEQFLVSHKPLGPEWSDPKGYALCMLDENGNTVEIYRDPEISCWCPIPFKARPLPRVLRSTLDPDMAERDEAVCVVTDIYHGMDGVERGTVKYLRVLEQIPRPWNSRRYWGGDSGYGQQHVVTTRSTHLGLKIQHGVVPVEEDGSAQFYVPTKSNVFFQALDENYRSVQTERTLVNYMPGEVRACVGCHETPNDAATPKNISSAIALRRAPSKPGPQPGDDRGQIIIDFRTMVQPVLDKHCVECHSGKEPKAGLVLTGDPTPVFNQAYENLLNKRVCGKINNEVGPKTGNAEYQPPYTFGTYSSILGRMIAGGDLTRPDEDPDPRAVELAKEHAEVIAKMTLAEKVRIWNWIDTNCQFYGSYWGRRNVQYKDHPNFRPVSTFEEARSTECPIPLEQR